MPQYTQAAFRDDLAWIKESGQTDDPSRLGAAIQRAKSLLGAGGHIGSIVQGSNRHQLQTALSHCQAELAGLMTPSEDDMTPSEDDMMQEAPYASGVVTGSGD